MKKILYILLIILFTSSLTVYSQTINRYSQTTNAEYTPRSGNEIQAIANFKAQNRKNFQFFASEANSAFKSKQYGKCISSSYKALSTRYETNYIYYILGVSLYETGNYKEGKKNLKKSKRKGYPLAKQKLIYYKKR